MPAVAGRGDTDVMILGGGPAGAGAAVALATRGVRVTLFAREAEDGYEGLSLRSAALLRELGLAHAAAQLGELLPRESRWAGREAPPGGEHIVSRRRLHAALLADARAAGVVVIPGAAPMPRRTSDGWRMDGSQGGFAARHFIEARGRRVAPAAARGPRLLAVLAHCPALTGVPPGSRVVTVRDGWCWAIAFPHGGGALQFVGAPRDHAAATPAGRLQVALGEAEELRPWLAGMDASRPVEARGGTAQRAMQPAVARGTLCGDALVALDPLSGQGVFEALSAVPMTVAAALSTLDGEDQSLVARFVGERADAIWARNVDAACGFYRAQADHEPAGAFWRYAAAAYEALRPVAVAVDDVSPQIEWRPVLAGTRIVRARVVVTASQPRGAWLVEGVELAALLDALRQEPRASLAMLAGRCGRPEAAVARALDWLRRQGLDRILDHAHRAASPAAMASAGG